MCWPELQQTLTHGAGKASGAPRWRPPFPPRAVRQLSRGGQGSSPSPRCAPGQASSATIPAGECTRGKTAFFRRRLGGAQGHGGHPRAAAALQRVGHTGARPWGRGPAPEGCLGRRAAHRTSRSVGRRDNSRSRLIRRRLGPPVPNVARGRTRHKVAVVPVAVRVHCTKSTVHFPTAFSAGASGRDVIRGPASDLPLPSSGLQLMSPRRPAARGGAGAERSRAARERRTGGVSGAVPAARASWPPRVKPSRAPLGRGAATLASLTAGSAAGLRAAARTCPAARWQRSPPVCAERSLAARGQCFSYRAPRSEPAWQRRAARRSATALRERRRLSRRLRRRGGRLQLRSARAGSEP